MSKAIVKTTKSRGTAPEITYRLAGDRHLLVEYGPMVLDLNLRFRVHSLMEALEPLKPDGISELIPGVRSLLIKYDPEAMSLKRLMKRLTRVETTLPSPDDMRLSSRHIKLPLAFHDRWTLEAIQKYMKSVRAEGPYLPDNVDFVARCNGLDSPGEVLYALTGTELMVLGLGDVYLGAPCAVPLDPRKRLVVPKYNPARTYTPEGGVGIGGTYICIYPMESPGGYQLVGRTLPIWNTFQTTRSFEDAPWLLRFFDRITFQHVSEEELSDARAAMIRGDYALDVQEGEFVVRDYNRFTKSVEHEVDAFKRHQRAAAAEATEGY